ncbi:hypothetical protein L1887_53795 [Cichorium endivia]|nr:hypothetical protein L1887_53795 [Cichorium endivia]
MARPPCRKSCPIPTGVSICFPRALQMTEHDRWGVNVSNRMALTDTWALTLSGDFSKEKLKQTDNASDDIGSTYIFASNYLGPRGGRREQYNFTFNNEWAATSWLSFNAGARYSDYNSFDTTLDEYRKEQATGWTPRQPWWLSDIPIHGC